MTAGDLKDQITNLFTVDQFRSKMGDDENIIVLRFRAISKEPAIDLMEFIERGYSEVLDADMSAGEERDGYYSIFVEFSRDKEAPGQIKDMLDGMSKLCDHSTWRFRWYKDVGGHDFDVETFSEFVPLSAKEYEERVHEGTTAEINQFLDQGTVEAEISESTITFKKPYVGSVVADIESFGDYNELKESLIGAIQLDDQSRAETVFLNKYLGNYDINKINGKFLIRSGDKAMIIRGWV